MIDLFPDQGSSITACVSTLTRTNTSVCCLILTSEQSRALCGGGWRSIGYTAYDKRDWLWLDICLHRWISVRLYTSNLYADALRADLSFAPP